MILLFNTAYRLGYLKNVLRTIYLPEGAVNEYRYTIGVDQNISSKQALQLQALIGDSVLICFGDRYAAGGYEFHPRSCSSRGGNLKVA